ncbi:uncharacterized protein LOC124623901 isoform X1 [Schistocerca americana]|uniref:uncharacterized protein LOC124623901 isoform X1 n=1 Tax=Schistocerca americana TaxID=7009 RepID=UPI001F4FE678|nr:uncharacterized protein LOC124623901 isoform X1 [Schistocerca americana]
MLLLAALLCIQALAAESRLDCRCGETVCSCLILQPSPEDQLCAYTLQGTQCSAVGPAGVDSRLEHLVTVEGTVANPDCKCAGKFCACIVLISSTEDRICLRSSEGSLCSPVQKAMKRYDLLSRLISKAVESHDSCKCSGGACICSWSKLRPDSVVCMHSSERLSCTQVTTDDKDEARLISDDNNAACYCSNARCTCKWVAAGSGAEVCFYSAKDVRCHTHPTRDGAPPPADMQPLHRILRNAVPKRGCYCTNEICTCEWGFAIKTPFYICLTPEGECDRVDTTDKQPSQQLAPNSCSCSSSQCVCRWSKVKKGNRMCYHGNGVMCLEVVLKG